MDGTGVYSWPGEWSDLRLVDETDCTALYVPQANAMQYLHRNSIAHCDLKPENMLLKRQSDGTEVMKLIDFGVVWTDTYVGFGHMHFFSRILLLFDLSLMLI